MRWLSASGSPAGVNWLEGPCLTELLNMMDEGFLASDDCTLLPSYLRLSVETIVKRLVVFAEHGQHAA